MSIIGLQKGDYFSTIPTTIGLARLWGFIGLVLRSTFGTFNNHGIIVILLSNALVNIPNAAVSPLHPNPQPFSVSDEFYCSLLIGAVYIF